MGDTYKQAQNLTQPAYGWEPGTAEPEREMKQILAQNKGAESRMKLRLLVNQLDLEQQKESC